MNNKQIDTFRPHPGSFIHSTDVAQWGMPVLDVKPEEKDSAVKRLWAVMWPHKWLIAGCSLACAAIALGTSLLQTPEYKAQTSMEIEDLNGHFMQLDEVDPISQSNADSFLSTQIDMLSSRKLLERVVQRLHLDANYRDVKPGMVHSLLQKMNPLLFPSQTPKDMAVGDLKKNLTISAPRSTSRVVSIEYIAGSPRLAADVPNTLAQEFINQGIELRIQSAHGLNAWLTQELEQSRRRLEASEEALQQYGQSAGLLFTDETNSVAEAKLKQLQDELSKAQADRISKQSTYELVSHADADALGELVGDTTLQDYQIKLTDARRQLADAQAIMTPNHYKVKELAAQVAQLETAVAAERKRTGVRLAQDYGAARRREELLQQAYGNQARLVTAQDARASRYHVLKNEVDTNRQLYDSMLQRVKGVGLAAAIRSSNVAVFDPAEAPLRPYKPMPVINTAVGLIGGLMLACVYVFLRETWDQSLRAPGQVSSYLNVPELGVVPSTQKKFAPASKRGSLLGGSSTADVSEQMRLSDGFISGASAGYEAVRMADFFRGILASILLATGKDSPATLVLTSPSPKEGKTTNAANLAVALASIGKRVLLIDADLRKPRLHEIFDVRNTKGFSDLLVEHSQSNTAKPLSYVQETKIPGLSVLTSGGSRASGSNLLYGPWVPHVLNEFRQHFDTVLLDAPPVLSLADARLLSRHGDGVVLVCRAGATSRERAKIALELLTRDGANVIGTILNDFDTKASSYYRDVYDSSYSEAAG